MLISQISPEFNRAFELLQRMGIIGDDFDDVHTAVHSGSCDTGSEVNVAKGRFRLFVEDSNNQDELGFTIRVRCIDDGKDILRMDSPRRNPKTDAIMEPWSIQLDESIRQHRSLRDMVIRNWPGLLTAEAPSSLVPDGDQMDPESKFMFSFIQKLFAWFDLLSA